MRPRGRHAVALGLAATIAALAGCGGSGKESSQPTTGASTATTATPMTGARVVMGDYFFRPPSITVRVGQPVTFVNEGTIEHTVADTTPSGQIRSRLIKPRPLSTGQSQRVIFHVPGTVTYLCTFHPTLMSGRITVVKG